MEFDKLCAKIDRFGIFLPSEWIEKVHIVNQKQLYIFII